MADSKLIDLTATTTPASTDVAYMVADPSGTPVDRKVTLANLITKAHGLSDGIVKVASGTQTVVTAPSGTIVGTSDSQTLTNKTLTTPIISSISNTGTLTLPTATDTLVGRDTTDTLTNKTLTGNIAVNLISGGATVTLPTTTGTLATLGNAEVFTGAKTFGSAGDVGKLKIAGTTSGTTILDATAVASGTLTLPATTDTLVGKATTDTLTNKTLTSPIINVGSDADGDMYYRSSGALTRLPKGTASQTLKMNSGATAPEWVTASSGGQTLYDYVVASSGGDYTTLGACLAVAPAGSTIFVRSGTYTESSASTSNDNITVIGENPMTTIISHGSNAFQFLGGGYTIQNIGFALSTGTLSLGLTTTAFNRVSNCYFSMTGDGVIRGGGNLDIDNCYFNTDDGQVNFQSTTGHLNITNCHYYGYAKATVGGFYPLGQPGNSDGYANVTNCEFVRKGGTGILVGGASTNFVNCSFADSNQNCTLVKLGNPANFVNCTFWEADKHIDAGSYKVQATNCYFSWYYNTTDIKVDVYSYSNITGCYFSGQNASGSDIALQLGYQGSVVKGCYFTNVATAIKFKDATSQNNFVEQCTFGSVATAINDNSTGALNTVENCLGLSQIYQDKKYVYMKNTSGATVGAGDIVHFKNTASAGDEFTTAITSNTSFVYGVATASITNNSYGYVQVLGKTTLLKVDGTTDIAVGDYICQFTTAGIGYKASTGDYAIAIALEAYTGNDSNGVIDALIIRPHQL